MIHWLTYKYIIHTLNTNTVVKEKDRDRVIERKREKELVQCVHTCHLDDVVVVVVVVAVRYASSVAASRMFFFSSLKCECLFVRAEYPRCEWNFKTAKKANWFKYNKRRIKKQQQRCSMYYCILYCTCIKVYFFSFVVALIAVFVVLVVAVVIRIHMKANRSSNTSS